MGTDLSDTETELVEVELDWSNGPMDYGFQLAGGKSHPVFSNDYGLYVVSVSRGGPADGKLKINDCLVKVGSVNCTAADSDVLWNLLRSSKLPISLTVKRRRSTNQGLYTVKLPVGRGVPHGLTLEHGVFIRSVAPGSAAARESSLKSGDRLCSINSRPVDSLSSINEVRSRQATLSISAYDDFVDQICRILDDSFSHNEGAVITVVRGSSPASLPAYPMSLPSLGSPSSSSSAQNMTEEEGQMEGHYSTGRRGQNSSKQSKDSLSSNATSNVSSANSIASAGLYVLDLFRDTVSRNRRSHNKDKSDHHAESGKRQSSDIGGSPATQASGPDREAAAIAVLENVIDTYNARSSAANNTIGNGGAPGTNKVSASAQVLHRGGFL